MISMCCLFYRGRSTA